MSKKVKIAFTSCVRYEAFSDQPQWEDIEQTDPDYLFLLGDQIYMDYGIFPFSKEPNGKPKSYSEKKFQKVMDEKYSRQWNEPHFKRLFNRMKAKNAVFGVWDDHDFAWNNACGNDVPESIKNISRNLFHKWIGSSTNKPEVYCSIDIPMARVIFLDNRYYSDTPHASDANLLGNRQFEFLSEKLEHKHKYTIICSGLTLTQGKENWSNYKEEYKNFCELISNKERVLFLAGDIHKNKFLLPSVERPCYEICSSGLAVNYMGLPFGFDNQHNWGLLEYDDDEILVILHDKKRSTRYKIDSHSWDMTYN